MLQYGQTPTSSECEFRELDCGHVLFIGAREGRCRSISTFMHRNLASSVVGFGQSPGQIAFAELLFNNIHHTFVSGNSLYAGDTIDEYATTLPAFEDTVAEASVA